MIRRILTKLISCKYYRISYHIKILGSSESFEGKYNIVFEIPIKFKVKEKKYSNRSINKEIRKLDFCGPESNLRKSTIIDFESPSNLQVKENLFFEIGPETTKLCFN